MALEGTPGLLSSCGQGGHQRPILGPVESLFPFDKAASSLFSTLPLKQGKVDEQFVWPMRSAGRWFEGDWREEEEEVSERGRKIKAQPARGNATGTRGLACHYAPSRLEDDASQCYFIAVEVW